MTEQQWNQCHDPIEMDRLLHEVYPYDTVVSLRLEFLRRTGLRFVSLLLVQTEQFIRLLEARCAYPVPFDPTLVKQVQDETNNPYLRPYGVAICSILFGTAEFIPALIVYQREMMNLLANVFFLINLILFCVLFFFWGLTTSVAFCSTLWVIGVMFIRIRKYLIASEFAKVIRDIHPTFPVQN